MMINYKSAFLKNQIQVLNINYNCLAFLKIIIFSTYLVKQFSYNYFRYKQKNHPLLIKHIPKPSLPIP